MKEKNKNDIDVSDGGILHVFCFDSVNLKDKITFDACIVDGIQVTYWMEDESDIKEILKGMFDILFKEVIKNRGKKPDSGA